VFKSVNLGVDWAELGDLNSGASSDIKGLTDFSQDTSLDFQVKSCDDDACSGESWADITDISPQDLSLDNLTYFQYKFNFLTDDSSYTPELYDVSIDYTLLNVAPFVTLASPQDGANYGYNESLALDFCFRCR